MTHCMRTYVVMRTIKSSLHKGCIYDRLDDTMKMPLFGCGDFRRQLNEEMGILDSWQWAMGVCLKASLLPHWLLEHLSVSRPAQHTRLPFSTSSSSSNKQPHATKEFTTPSFDTDATTFVLGESQHHRVAPIFFRDRYPSAPSRPHKAFAPPICTRIAPSPSVIEILECTTNPHATTPFWAFSQADFRWISRIACSFLLVPPLP